MSVFSVRNVLPVVTSVVATLFLATAVPHGLVPEATAAELGMAPAALARARGVGRRLWRWGGRVHGDPFQRRRCRQPAF